MIKLTPFAISGLLIVATHLPLLIILIKKSNTKVAKLFVLHLLMILAWGIQTFLYGKCKSPEISLLIGQFGYPFIIFISIFYLHTIIALDKKYEKPPFIFLLYMIGTIFSIRSLTNKMFTSTKLVFNSYYYPQGDAIFLASALFWAINVIIGHCLLVHFYWTRYPLQRRKILPFIIIIPIYVELGWMNYLPALGINIYPIGNFLLPFYSLTVTYAILKHQILDIEIIIKKGIVYTTIITLVSLFYLITIVLFEKIVQGYLGYNSLLISICIAFSLGILFIPLRNKIQHLVDKLFFQRSSMEIVEENKKLKDEIERAERLKAVATLASGVAHEIKNPLTAIKTFAEYLPQKLDDKEFLAQFSKIVGKEVNRIDEMVHELLDFARPAPLKVRDANIHKVIDETLTFLSSQFLQHKIKVEKNFAAPQGLKIKIDPDQFTQALLNILLNAIEAMPSGGNLTVTTNIRISGNQDIRRQSTRKSGHQVEATRSADSPDNPPSGSSDTLMISILDTGHGISKEDLPHIFDPFFTKKDGGTGLGLSVTQSILEKHGGKLSVQSKPGEGAEFVMELPLNAKERENNANAK